jgi:carbon storage regulator
MLVLTRKAGEELVLPDLGVRITLLVVAGNRVRVGVQAPSDVVVLRGELEDVWQPAVPSRRAEPVGGQT